MPVETAKEIISFIEDEANIKIYSQKYNYICKSDEVSIKDFPIIKIGSLSLYPDSYLK